WVDTLPLRCALDRVRARAHLARGEEDAAKQLIERVLQDDPTSTVGWELAIETAPEDERGELARRAREATGATHFEQKAREISGLTPGALAREVLVARPETLADVFRSVFARARALQAEQRAFLGMGIARILAAREVEIELVEAFLEIWLDDPEAEPTWIAEAFLLEEWAEALRVLRGFLPRAYSSDPSSVSTEALQDLVVVAAAHESDFADVLFGEVALPLTRTELAKLRMRMRSAPADVAFRRARQRADEAHDALHPELCLDQLDDFVDIEDDLLIDDGDWDELDDGLDEEDVDQVLADLRGAPGSLRKDLERAPPAVADGLLRSMLAQLEVPSELFANIPRKAKIDFLCSVLAGGPNTTLETLQAALAVLITSAAGGARAPRPRTQRKKPKPKRRKKR
ncbi:MAG: hypothetical protein KF901_08515, partial [Myxococcales bacterium]|nr:hypothetical protein [Myxococcales bacterium]